MWGQAEYGSMSVDKTFEQTLIWITKQTFSNNKNKII